jgi:hypothetical protein
MLNLDTVKLDIERWLVDFVEVKNPALGGWPPCPYARKARLERDFEVRLGKDLGSDLAEISRNGINKSVVIVVYEGHHYAANQFNTTINNLNEQFLVRNNLLALADHPDDSEMVNGVCMNQGTYALALVQSLSDLNDKAKVMGAKGFYDTWPEEYLEMLFHHREDPRR